MIPRLLHLIWVGDEAKRPEQCIQSWIDLHPGWQVKVWGNADLADRAWINERHIRSMAGREWNGVADMMRWEILFEHGGVLVDADSFCLRPLPEWMLDCEAFTCWENELARPGLIAAGYFGSIPRTPFLASVIKGIQDKPTVIDRMAWETVGPLHLTEMWKQLGYNNLTILPSHFFIPRHFTGLMYSGPGPVYAHQEWGSTLGTYGALARGKAGTAPGPSPHAFLHEPDWREAEWVEVLLSYVEAFRPGDPVALILVLDSGTALADAQETVLQMLVRAGRETFPDVILLDRPEELLEQLQRYPGCTWVPRGRGETRGLRGFFGARLAEARRKLTMP